MHVPLPQLLLLVLPPNSMLSLALVLTVIYITASGYCQIYSGDELLNVVNRICSSLPAIGNYPIFTDRCNTCVSRAGSTPASQVSNHLLFTSCCTQVACLCGTQLELYLDAISPKQQDKWEKIAIFNGITAAIALVLLLLWICSQVGCYNYQPSQRLHRLCVLYAWFDGNLL